MVPTRYPSHVPKRTVICVFDNGGLLLILTFFDKPQDIADPPLFLSPPRNHVMNRKSRGLYRFLLHQPENKHRIGFAMSTWSIDSVTVRIRPFSVKDTSSDYRTLCRPAVLDRQVSGSIPCPLQAVRKTLSCSSPTRRCRSC